MTRVTGRQVWLSILATALFAPVVLASALPPLRPPWLAVRVAGLPVSSWLVLGLIVLFVAMVLALAASPAGGEEADR